MAAAKAAVTSPSAGDNCHRMTADKRVRQDFTSRRVLLRFPKRENPLFRDFLKNTLRQVFYDDEMQTCAFLNANA